MEDETTNNNIDFAPIIEGLETLNKSSVSNGEKLDSVLEYLIALDNEEAEKERAEYDKKQSEIKTDETRQEETTVLLTDIRDQTILNNYLLSGQIFFMGLIFGALLLKILWDRFIR